MKAEEFRYVADGPQGMFATDDLALASAILAAFDTDGDWTVTDALNPFGAPERTNA